MGRHVFPALNSVECALAVTLAMMVTKWGTAGTAPATIPLVLGGMVAAQTLCLTPALSLRAQHLIATSSKPEQLSAAQQAALEGIKKVREAVPLVCWQAGAASLAGWRGRVWKAGWRSSGQFAAARVVLRQLND